MSDEQRTAAEAPGTELATTPGGSSFDASLAAERVAERTVMRSVVRSIAIGVPIGIAVMVGLVAWAVGDDLEWYTILGVGTLLGLVAAVLFGMLGGVTIAAHAFEDVDRGTAH